nr:MAG TPA: hypothetical protein [Caudoviricetes sp.]
MICPLLRRSSAACASEGQYGRAKAGSPRKRGSGFFAYFGGCAGRRPEAVRVMFFPSYWARSWGPPRLAELPKNERGRRA